MSIVEKIISRSIGGISKAFSRLFDFKLDFDLDLSSAFDFKPESTEFQQTGSLKYSSLIKGFFYRYHNPKYFSINKFYDVFSDSPRKWAAKERYAGSDFNCGHYFSLTRDGARKEMLHYNRTFRKRKLLVIEACFDNIFDLTYETNIRSLLREVIYPFGISDKWSFMQLLSLLIDENSGGICLTDYIGSYLSDNGYNGVLFFGARSINSNQRLMIDWRKDTQAEFPIVGSTMEELRADENCKNLVIFNSFELTRQIMRFKLGFRPWKANTFYGMNTNKLDSLLKYNNDFQNEKREQYVIPCARVKKLPNGKILIY